MKIIFKTSVFAVAFTISNLYLYAQDTINTNFSKMVVELAGVNSIHDYTLGKGATIRAEYLLSKKLGIGVKSFITSYNIVDQYDNVEKYDKYGYNVDSYLLTEEHKPGKYLAFDINATYFILGNNTSSRFGLYTNGGFGYHMADFQISLYHSNVGYYYSNSLRSNGLGLHVGLGGAIKLGIGRVIVEANYREIIFKNSSNLNYGTEVLTGKDGSTHTFVGKLPELYWAFALSLGYAYNF